MVMVWAESDGNSTLEDSVAVEVAAVVMFVWETLLR